MKTQNSTVLSAVLAVMTVGVWWLGDYINSNLAELAVRTVPNKQSAPTEPFDVKSLFPVWVSAVTKGRVLDSNTPVDSVFKDQPEKAESPAPSPEPDYAALLPTRLHVDGIAGEGAFINGKFYHVGEAITDFEYEAGGRAVIPHLVEVKARSVIVVHGSHKTELKA